MLHLGDNPDQSRLHSQSPALYEWATRAIRLAYKIINSLYPSSIALVYDRTQGPGLDQVQANAFSLASTSEVSADVYEKPSRD